MFIVLLRTIILYALVVLVMRLMGKRQIGELQPYEFVITIMISDLAALPMQDTRLPLLLGIIPIITLLFVKTLLTQLQLKSQLARKIIEGEPCIVICGGKVNFEVLKKQQINLDELMEELRLAGYFDLKEIQYAILENNGKFSFLTYDSDNNNNSKSLSKPVLPIIYVLDGKLNKNSLTSSNKDALWITEELKKHNISNINNVLLAMTDTTGNFIYQLHDEYDERCTN